MKKLLSILGAITLVGTVTPNVISCHNKKITNSTDISAKDLEVFNEIQTKASEKINQKIKSNTYVDSLKNNLSKIYSKVNKGDTEPYQLKLSNSEDNKLATYFISDFTRIFDSVNRDLQNEYSNYFVNEMPLTLDDERNVIKVTYIDVENLRDKFPASVKPELFSAVRVDYKATIQLKFKQMYASFEISSIYNVAENVSALQVFSDKAVNFLIQNIKDYFNELESTSFSENEIFKPLYDKMIWDFSKNSVALNDTLKNAVKTYIASKKEFKDITMSYNAVDLLEQDQKGDLNYENKGYDGLSTSKDPKELTLSNWIKDKESNWNDIGGITGTDFANFYKTRVASVFNVDDNIDLVLGTFKIKLNYFNIYGLGLAGTIKNKDNEDATITLNLSRSAIDKKLTNWGKIIIAFLNYANGAAINKNQVNFGVPKEIYSKMLTKNQKNGLKDVTKLLVDDFKNADNAKDLEDIESFNLISHPLFPRVKGESRYRDPSALFWDEQTQERWAILFTFGEDLDTGLFYSFASRQQNVETETNNDGVNLGMFKKV